MFWDVLECDRMFHVSAIINSPESTPTCCLPQATITDCMIFSCLACWKQFHVVLVQS